MAIQLKSFSPGSSTSPIVVFVGGSVLFGAEFYEDTVGFFDGETARNGRPITRVQWQVSPNYDPVSGTGNWNNLPGGTDLQDGGTYNNGVADFKLWTSEYLLSSVNAGNNGNYVRLGIISDTNDNPDAIGDATVPDPDTVLYTDIVLTEDDPTDRGYRELSVSANPEIVVFGESLGDPVKIVSVDGSTAGDPASTGATYVNRSASTPSDLDNLYIVWQYSFDYDPINDFFGGTWIDINDETGPGTYTNLLSLTGTSTTDAVITENIVFNSANSIYVKESTLILQQAGFDFNASYFRPTYRSTGVLESPVITYNYFQLLINPEIFILQNPGENAGDTNSPAYSFGDGNPSNGVNPASSGGDILISINAFSTAGSLSILQYEWQVRLYTDYTIYGEGETLLDRGDPATANDFVPVSLYNGKTFLVLRDDNVLELSNALYVDAYEFRCVITGSSAEPEVTSLPYKIYMRDGALSSFISNNESVTGPFPEDYYGDILNRELFTDKPIRTVSYDTTIDGNNYTGFSGNILYNFEVSNDNGITFNPVPGSESELRLLVTPLLSSVGDTVEEAFFFTTKPLTISSDQGNIYRAKVISSSYWDTSGWNPGDPKSFLPFYYEYSPLELKRELFVINNPTNINVFVSLTASFSADVDITSDSASVVRQWQWAKLNANLVPGTFTNLADGEFFATTGETGPTGSGQNTVSGINSSVLQINNTTLELSNYVFRLSANAPDSIGSVTTSYASINFVLDNFTELTSISDKIVPEFSSVDFSVTASTISGGTITYQWQKSTNNGATYFDLSDGATPSGSTLFGTTTSTLTITGITQPEDEGLYRLRATSFGGITEFTNEAKLTVDEIEIVILEQFDTTNLRYIEETIPFPPFSILAASTTGEDVTYQWQFRRNSATPPGNDWQNFPTGYKFQSSAERIFTPSPFLITSNPDTTDDDIDVRCLLSIPSLGTNYTFSAVGNLQVIRELSYTLGSTTRIVENNTSFTISLNPTFTGPDTPTYTWQYSTNNGASWNNTNSLSGSPANGFSTIFFSSVPSSWNNYLIRCQIQLDFLEQLRYVRAGIQQIETVATIGTGFTYPIRLSVVSEELIPTYYSNENSKTGCAIGTVICVPKPPYFVDQIQTNQGDDRERWGVSRTGSTFANGLTASSATYNLDFTRYTSSQQTTVQSNRQSIQTQNLAYLNRNGNWISNPSNVKTPAWIIDRFAENGDRFPGFIMLRGQWLYVDEFPLLYKVIGDTYGTYTNATGKRFKLPNPYGKRLLGTGAVDSRKGTVTVIPEYEPNGLSGGSTDQPGSVGGRYIYTESAQLPPGSPGINGEEDGTAGVQNPGTFILGNYRTEGWEEITGITTPKFRGTFRYKVGPIEKSVPNDVPSHIHNGTGIGKFEDDERRGSANCKYFQTLPGGEGLFGEVLDGLNGDLLTGPAYIDQDKRGRLHTHGIDSVGKVCGDGKEANEGSGVGDVKATDTYFSPAIVIDNRSGAEASLNSFVEIVDFTLAKSSRTPFDANLSFFLRNAEAIPIRSDYFRLKWMIKAY